MSRAPDSTMRELALAPLLTVLGLAAFAFLPKSAAAQEACFGPFATYEEAAAECHQLLSIGYCSPTEIGIYGYTTPDGFYAQACCCIPLVSILPPPAESLKPLEDEEREDERSEE